jgi:hypothetical protein
VADAVGARSTRNGPGRLLVAVYGVFAISATARAGYQVATKLAEAPAAYLLSALAAVVYLVATVSLARSTETSRRVAWGAVLVELAGVLAVGVLTLVDAADFPDETVWSGFGRGYGYVPLVLPLLGIAWLWWTGRSARPQGGVR